MSAMGQYLLLSIAGGLPAGLFALLAYIKGRENEARLEGLRIALNGRMDDLLRQKGIASRSEGRQEGIDSVRSPPRTGNDAPLGSA